MGTEQLSSARRRYRILLVICWPVGGIRTFLRYVYNSFERSRYSLTLLAPDQPELRTLLEDLREFDPTYLPVPHHPKQPGFPLSVARAIVSGGYDLVHSQGFMAGLYSAVPARLSRTPHMLTPHDVLSPGHFVGFKGTLKRSLLTFLLPMIDVIQCVSDDARKSLIESIPRLGRREDKVITIRNGIDANRFSGSEARDLRAELNLPGDTFLIGFLGRFMSQKGFRYLVDAMELLHGRSDLPRKPVIVATGVGGFIREDRGYLNGKGLEDHACFLPFSPNIAPLLKGLDVVAIPSISEAGPLLPMEAMVAGVPVIGTDCIGLREVLRDTPSRMVPAANSVELANAIEAEMKNPSTAEARAFSQQAIGRFDVRQQAGRMEEVILRLIGDVRSHPR